MILSVWFGQTGYDGMGVQGVSARRGVSQTQSAFQEGLLDLIQHIPQQRWLATLGVDGDRLIGLDERET